jgi:FSR family fosmidomycin resistance protein-like MFS transporter
VLPVPISDAELVSRRPADAAGPAERAELSDSVQLATLSAGHAVTDTYGQSLLAPIFPILRERLGLSLDQIGALPMVMGLSASLGQPLIGYVTDRWPKIPAVALGPALAAVFVGMLGFAPSYMALALLLFFAGLGIGAFHPQGASLATRAARGRGQAMSAFTIGGNLGFGIAPLLGSWYFRWFGLERFYLASIPGVVFAALMMTLLRFPERQSAAGSGAARLDHARTGNPYALALLTGTVVVRSAVLIAISTFLAFLLRDRLPGSGETEAGIAVSVFLLANALSGFVGGYLTDRFGRSGIMLGSLAVAPLLLTLALQLPGFWIVGGLALGGFVLMLPHPANVIMAQEYMPGNAGVAASMITGLAWGVGQFLCWPLGALAEHVGLEPALCLIFWLPWLGVIPLALLFRQSVAD